MPRKGKSKKGYYWDDPEKIGVMKLWVTFPPPTNDEMLELHSEDCFEGAAKMAEDEEENWIKLDNAEDIRDRVLPSLCYYCGDVFREGVPINTCEYHRWLYRILNK